MKSKVQGFLALALAAGSFVFAAEVRAGPAYKADDIVKAFAKQPAATDSLGASRSVGWDEPVKPVTSAPFDLVVTFKFNSDELTTEAKENLDQFALALKTPEIAGKTFEIDGHTDAKGSPTYNLELSKRRAEAVVQYLVSTGLDEKTLMAKGFGKTKPRVKSNPYSPEKIAASRGLAD